MRSTTARSLRRKWNQFAGVFFAVLLTFIFSACHQRDLTATAHSLLANREGDRAVEILQQGVESNPGDLGLQLELGRTLSSLGKFSRATWPLMRATESTEFADEARLLLANALVSSRNYTDAIRVTSELLDRQPDDHHIRRIRAQALLNNHREAEAIEDIDLLLDSNPDDLDLLESKLRGLLRLEMADESIELVTELRARAEDAEDGEKIKKSAPRLCALDAVFASEREEMESARSLFEACLAQYPGNDTVVTKSIEFFDKQAEFERSLEVIRAAIESEPNVLRYREFLAGRLEAMARSDEALAVLVQAFEDSPTPVVASALAQFHVTRDEIDQARAALERGYLEAERRRTGSETIELSDDELFALMTEDHRFVLGDLLVLLGEEKRVARLIPHLEEPAYAEFLRARSLYESGDFAGASRAYDKGFRYWPSNSGARYLAGRTAEQLGNFDTAIGHYRESIRSNKASTDASMELARIQLAQGNLQASAEALRHQLEGHPHDPKALRQLADVTLRLGRRKMAQSARSTLAEIPGQSDAALADQLRDLANLKGLVAAKEFAARFPKELVSADYPETLAMWCEIVAHREGLIDEAIYLIDFAAKSSQSTEHESELHGLRGTVLSWADRDAEAKVEFDRALELNPDNFTALLGLARQESNDNAGLSGALRLYDRARAVSPEDHRPSIESAQLLLDSVASRSGDNEALARAEERLRAVLLAEPTHGDAATLLAGILVDRSPEDDVTLEMAQRATRFSPANSDAAGYLARAFMARNEPAAAAAVLEWVVENGFADGHTYYSLGEAWTAAGEQAKATAAFKQATEADPFPELDSAKQAYARLSSDQGDSASSKSIVVEPESTDAVGREKF